MSEKVLTRVLSWDHGSLWHGPFHQLPQLRLQHLPVAACSRTQRHVQYVWSGHSTSFRPAGRCSSGTTPAEFWLDPPCRGCSFEIAHRIVLSSALLRPCRVLHCRLAIEDSFIPRFAFAFLTGFTCYSLWVLRTLAELLAGDTRANACGGSLLPDSTCASGCKVPPAVMHGRASAPLVAVHRC